MTAPVDEGMGDEGLDGFVAAAAAMLGLELDDRARESVRDVLRTLAAHAALIADHPLRDEA